MSEPFDPDAYLAKKAAQTKEKAQPAKEEPGWFDPKSASGAWLRGGGQGASFGFSDELGGALVGGGARLADLAAKATGASDEQRDEMMYRLTGALPRSQGGQGADGSAYKAVRDDMRKENKQAKDESPWHYGISELAGNLAVPLGVGGKALNIAGKPSLAAGRALVGAGLGAVSGTGMSEGEDALEVAGDAAGSAIIGGIAAPIIGWGTDKAGTSVARWLQKASDENALKASGLTAGINDKARQLGIETEDELRALGAWARDNGMIRPLGRAADVARRSEAAIREASDAKTLALEELSNMAREQGKSFNFNKLAMRAKADLMPKQGWDPVSQENAKQAFQTLGRASAAEGDFLMADQVRRAVGNSINWKAAAMGQTTPEAVMFQRKAYRTIADELADQAAEVEKQHLANTWNRMKAGGLPGPDDLGATNQLKAMNQRMSKLLDIEALANQESTRAMARQSLGLKDSILGAAITGGGVVAGADPLTATLLGSAVGGANAFARARAPSALTHIQNATAKELPKLAPKATAPLIRAGSENRRLPRAYAQMKKLLGLKSEDEER